MTNYLLSYAHKLALFACRRIPMEDLPETHEELNTFCHKMYQHKVSRFINHCIREHSVQHLPTYGTHIDIHV